MRIKPSKPTLPTTTFQIESLRNNRAYSKQMCAICHFIYEKHWLNSYAKWDFVSSCRTKQSKATIRYVVIGRRWWNGLIVWQFHIMEFCKRSEWKRISIVLFVKIVNLMANFMVHRKKKVNFGTMIVCKRS